VSICVQVGTKTTRKYGLLEIWALQRIQGPKSSAGVRQIALLELNAYSADGKEISNVPGTGLDPSWLDVKYNIDILTPFVGLNSLTELRCLVRYAILLAANARGQIFALSTIPQSSVVTKTLINICKRRWFDERLAIKEATGVTVSESEIWKTAVAPLSLVERSEDVRQYDESDSSGEDEIPHEKPR
jgi:hypothetical protein